MERTDKQIKSYNYNFSQTRDYSAFSFFNLLSNSSTSNQNLFDIRNILSYTITQNDNFSEQKKANDICIPLTKIHIHNKNISFQSKFIPKLETQNVL